MNQNKLDSLRKSLDSISPSDLQKQKILNNILDTSVNGQHSSLSIKPRYLYPLIASLILVVSSSSFYISSSKHNELKENTDYTDYHLQSAPSHIGMRQFMNYNGNRYVVLESIPDNFLGSLTLTDSLGILETPIEFSDTSSSLSDSSTILSSTFAVGGEAWATSDYNSNYRIVVKHDDLLYLCELVGKADDSQINISEFIISGDFYNRISQIDIISKTNIPSSTILINNECTVFLDKLSNATFISASDINYDELFSADSVANSLSILFKFNDTTITESTFYPSLSILSLGDNYFVVPSDIIN